MEQNPTDDELRSYLLGELPEHQAEALEERILKDDELFDEVESLEADLLDAASRGDLAPAERERVLWRLASSPEGRERFALTRSLNIVADEGEEEEKEAESRVLQFLPRPKPAFQWVSTLAASGLLAMVSFSLFMQLRPITPMSTGGNPPVEIADERPTRRDPTLSGSPESEAAATETPSTESSPIPDQIAGTGEKTPELRPEPVLLQLSLMTLRGSEEKVEKRSLPSNTYLKLELDLDLADLDSSGTFHATVRSSKDKKVIWENNGLTAKDDLGWTKAALVLNIPRESLPPGRYEVAVTKGSDPEVIQEFDIVQEDH